MLLGVVVKKEVRLFIFKKVDIKYESMKLKVIINIIIVILGIMIFFNILIFFEWNLEFINVLVVIWVINLK